LKYTKKIKISYFTLEKIKKFFQNPEFLQKAPYLSHLYFYFIYFHIFLFKPQRKTFHDSQTPPTRSKIDKIQKLFQF